MLLTGNIKEGYNMGGGLTRSLGFSMPELMVSPQNEKYDKPDFVQVPHQ